MLYTIGINIKPHMSKSYPLGLDNPYIVRAVVGSTKWAIYRKENLQKIATFPSQFTAYECRRALLKFEGYAA